MVWWDNNFISNDIIYERRTQCAEIADIADIAYLYRRRAYAKNRPGNLLYNLLKPQQYPFYLVGQVERYHSPSCF